MEHTLLQCPNSGQAYSGQTGENPLYKGGWWKIGYHQEGRDKSEYLNPRLALGWPHPCSLPIEWGSRGCPRMSILDHGWYWTPRSGCRQQTDIGQPTSPVLWSTPEESAWQRFWRRQRTADSERSGRRNQKIQTQSPPIFSCVSGISHVTLKDPLAMGVGLWLI